MFLCYFACLSDQDPCLMAVEKDDPGFHIYQFFADSVLLEPGTELP